MYTWVIEKWLFPYWKYDDEWFRKVEMNHGYKRGQNQAEIEKEIREKRKG